MKIHKRQTDAMKVAHLVVLTLENYARLVKGYRRAAMSCKFQKASFVLNCM